MKKNQKYSIAAGIVLFILAALFSISLLVVAVDFGGINPVKNTVFYTLGKMFTGVYGFSSAFIPIFFIAAGVQCFSSKWRIRNGVMLLGSVIPFFSLDAIEHICRMIVENNTDSVMMVKLGSTLLIGALILCGEYLLLSILGDIFENSFNEAVEENQYIFDETEDAEPFESEDEESEEKDRDGNGILENSADTENQPETKVDEAKIDFSKDKIFLQQKEVLKDLINEGKPEKAKDEDKTILATGDSLIGKEPQVVENKDAEEVELIPETITEEELLNEDDFAEPVTQDATSPFDHIFEEQEKAHEEELKHAEEETLIEDSPIEDLSEESPEEDKTIIEEEPIFQELSEEQTRNEVLSEPQVDEEINEELDFSEPVLEEVAPAEEPEEALESISDGNPAKNSYYELSEPDYEDDLSPEPTYEQETPMVADIQKLGVEAIEETDDSNEIIDQMNKVFSSDEDFEEPNIQNPIPQENNGQEDFAAEPERDFNQDFDDMSDMQPADFGNDEDMIEEDDVMDDIEAEPYIPEEDFDGSELEEPVLDNTELDEPEIEEEFFDSANEDEDFEEPVAPAQEDKDSEVEETIEEDFDDFQETLAENAENSQDETEEIPDIVENPDDFDTPPSEYIDIDDINEFSEEDDDDDEAGLEVDDIFSQMESDAAANPVLKDKDKFLSEQAEIKQISPTISRRLSEYKIPTDLLEKFENDEYWRIDDETKQAGENLKQTLNEFGIEAEVTGIRKGPVVTMFELLPAPGVKLSKIVNLQDNIALSLAAKSVRIVAPIPGKHAVGIEIPNKERAIVSFREIIEQPLPEFKKMAIPVILGKDISGQSQIIDIAKTPHLLIAGATGAGKSVCVNSIILSILYNRSPRDVKLIMVDPKVVELKLYNDIPHLLTPVVTEPKKALQVLQYCICEMERRYALLDGMGVRDIVSYNTRIRERKIATEKLPYIVVIIDEFADLMATSGKELETSVARLTAMSRAVGIHLVLATQRPSVNVITGLIKANIPSRIAFMVASRTDSNIIIDAVGAEKLLGKGDMLYTSAVNPIPTRIQGTLVGDNEVERVVDYVKSFGGPDYIDDEIFIDDEEEGDDEPGLFSDGEDPLYDQALQIVIQAGKASASYIQRRLKIGYNRAARLVEEMEERGIVGPANGSKPREVIHVP